MKIKCCYGCEAPKRHAGCHDVCEEYLAEKSKLEEYKELERAERQRRDTWHFIPKRITKTTAREV